jgi:hypothetical protein
MNLSHAGADRDDVPAAAAAPSGIFPSAIRRHGGVCTVVGAAGRYPTPVSHVIGWPWAVVLCTATH